jgi:integrase
LGAGSCDVSLTHENSLSTSVNAAGWPRLPTIGTDIAQSTARIARSRRDLAIFNLAIDSKLRACDLVKLRLDDICSGAKVRHRATIVKKKTGRPVQFEITEQSRSSVEAWLRMLRAAGSRYLFPSRLHASPHISTRHARLVHRWVESIGLESALFGTHSMRRTKAAQIYRTTGNLRSATPPRPYEAGEHRPDILGLR